MMKYDYMGKSMETIGTWILKNAKRGFRKIEGSSYDGYMYEIVDESTGIKFNVDIRLSEESAVIFEVYPEIHVSRNYFLSAVELYCQSIETEFGSVNVGAEQKMLNFIRKAVLLKILFLRKRWNYFRKRP